MRISDWSSDVCSSDLDRQNAAGRRLSPEQSPILPVGLLVTAAVFRMSAARQQIQERNMAYYDYDYRSRSDRSRAPRGDRMSNPRSEEHTSELQSLMRTSYAVFCLKKKKQ